MNFFGKFLYPNSFKFLAFGCGVIINNAIIFSLNNQSSFGQISNIALEFTLA